ncbi:Pur operon repressor [compost metagenome]
MMDLLSEFRATVKGVGVFVDSDEVEEHLVEDYISLARLTHVDSRSKQVKVVLGNYFESDQ